MKVVIDIPDLEDLFYADNEYINGKDIKEIIVNRAIDELMTKFYDNGVVHRLDGIAKNRLKELFKSQQDHIINQIIENVSETIMKKKAIVEQMPKKSEINTINKEWETYFVELIDKAIARKFK